MTPWKRRCSMSHAEDTKKVIICTSHAGSTRKTKACSICMDNAENVRNRPCRKYKEIPGSSMARFRKIENCSFLYVRGPIWFQTKPCRKIKEVLVFQPSISPLRGDLCSGFKFIDDKSLLFCTNWIANQINCLFSHLWGRLSPEKATAASGRRVFC